jgi:hypothetical protein
VAFFKWLYDFGNWPWNSERRKHNSDLLRIWKIFQTNEKIKSNFSGNKKCDGNRYQSFPIQTLIDLFAVCSNALVVLEWVKSRIGAE